MENTMLVVLLLFTVVILVKIFLQKSGGVGAELIDLKNQLTELKTKQLEAQNVSLKNQQEAFNTIIRTITNSLSKTQSNINEQLGSTGKTINEVQKKLGALEEATRNVQKVGEDISSLQDILRSPKLRGNIGEYLLEDLLKQIFPKENYEIKYTFKNGTQVDAAIKLESGIIPVDSKFPLESFQRLIGVSDEAEKKKFKKEFIRSVKERIDEIADKYINPDEGTFDFALMYIPAENVFYEMVINDSFSKGYEIFNYAIQKHVIPVSPNSFYAYLMAIAFGLKGFRIEKQARAIMGELSKVQDAFSRFYTDFSLVGRHIGNASSKYEECRKKAVKVNEKLSKITGTKTELIDTEENRLPEN